MTLYYTGRIVALNATEIMIEDAAWIADTGRFSTALASGFSERSEIEPFPDGVVSIARGVVVDVCTWAHPLPRTVR